VNPSHFPPDKCIIPPLLTQATTWRISELMRKSLKWLLFSSLVILIATTIANKPVDKKPEPDKDTPTIVQKPNGPAPKIKGINKKVDLDESEPQKQEAVEIDTTTNLEINQESTFLVTKVIDGDTISLSNGEVVRYIGIDTPETKHPSLPVQCFGAEASNKNKKLVEGKAVRLEKDVSETDKYGRLLRYVWIGDVFVNEYLVQQGFAQVSTYPPDVKYKDIFLQAQKEAREGNLGLWGTCGDFGTPVTPKPAKTSVQTPLPISGEWNCSGNTYNCTDFSTHTQAQSAFESCGGVGNDIHRLDADKDGLACENLP